MNSVEMVSDEIFGGLTYSLRIPVNNPTGDIYAVDWDRKHGWVISCREYGSPVWYPEGGLSEVKKGVQAYQEIVNQFGLDPNEFPIEEVAVLHPNILAALGTKDPISATMGDRRTSSQVRISAV